jgi:uncharacterized protein (TIGR04255 family)
LILGFAPFPFLFVSSGVEKTPSSMPNRPKNLPDFRNPPVNEVVLSFQFASLEKLKSPYVGLFWKSLRSQYPDISEQGEVQPVFETFGAPEVQTRIGFQAFLSPPMPRFWLQKEGQPDLLQIQRNRLMHNWRQTPEPRVYPRYEKIRAKFQKEIQKFEDFLKNEELGKLEVNQCELTYINLIEEVPGGVDLHACLEEISPLWSGITSDQAPGEIENSVVQLRYFLDDGNERLGRIHVWMQPAFRQTDLKPLFRVEITARGRPHGSSVAEAFELLDLERQAVVRTFAAVTTPEMHKLWGRTDVQH